MNDTINEELIEIINKGLMNNEIRNYLSDIADTLIIHKKLYHSLIGIIIEEVQKDNTSINISDVGIKTLFKPYLYFIHDVDNHLNILRSMGLLKFVESRYNHDTYSASSSAKLLIIINSIINELKTDK